MAVIERTLELLQHELGGAIALGDLHRKLMRELGSEAGSYHQLYHTLKQQQPRLIVLEPGATLHPDGGGEQPLRRESLPAVVVALGNGLPLDAPESILPLALATLQDLSAAAPECIPRAELAAAFMELEALQRTIGATIPTTTPPRDLPGVR